MIRRAAGLSHWRLPVLAGAVFLAGCGAKHTVGDKVVYDPGEPEQAAKKASPGKASGGGGGGPQEPPEPDPTVDRFVRAKGTSYGGEDWVAEVHREGARFWLKSPFDEESTYAMVRAATFLQGLRLAEEDFDRRRFSTQLAYWSWHPDSESGFGLFMKVLTKGFGKDARYRFDVRVEDLPEGGSRVRIRQHRQVMEEEPHEDVGDWVPAEKPDPEITRKYIKGLQRALGN